MGRGTKAEPLGAVGGIRLGALVLACCAAAAAVLVARSGGTSAVTPRAPLVVKASLDRTAVEFADPVTAQVSVLADRATAGAGHIVVHESLEPLTVLGRPVVTRATRGRLVLVTYTARASCLGDDCTGKARTRQIVLPPAHVEIGSRTHTVRWPVLTVSTRVSQADVGREHPRLRSDATPPAVSYRVDPGSLALALDIAAAVLAAAAVLLAGWMATVLYRRHRRRSAGLTGLALALALARDAEQRPPSDRRRALGLVASVLGPRDPRLADAADELAWSAPAPTTEALSELVTQVEQELNGDAR